MAQPALHQLLCTSAHFMCINKPSAYWYTAAAYGITISCPRSFSNTAGGVIYEIRYMEIL